MSFLGDSLHLCSLSLLLSISFFLSFFLSLTISFFPSYLKYIFNVVISGQRSCSETLFLLIESSASSIKTTMELFPSANIFPAFPFFRTKPPTSRNSHVLELISFFPSFFRLHFQRIFILSFHLFIQSFFLFYLTSYCTSLLFLSTSAF